MSDKELMDAVSAAIDGAGAQPAPAGDDDDAGTDTTNADATDGAAAESEAAAADDAAGGDSAARAAAGDGGGEGADNDGGTAAGAESGGRERDPKTGKFVAKKPDGEGTDPAAAAAKTGAQPGAPKPGAKPAAKPAAGAKPPDHVNDPIPEDVKGKTRERMQGLITAAKTLTTERDTLKHERDELLETIQATGAEPETFWRHTEVLRLMLSADANDQRNAVKHLRGAADKIAAQLGDPVPGHDPLKDPANKDLADEVEAGDLSRERALELAQARSRTAAEGRRTTETEQQRQAREQHEQAVDAARVELNTLGAELKKANPAMYAAKSAALLDVVKEMVQHTPPDRWAAAYRKLYDKHPYAPAKPANRAPRGTGTNQPARPTQGAGGGGPRAPQNELEALDLGIAAAAQVQR